jgi:hypothetical protein
MEVASNGMPKGRWPEPVKYAEVEGNGWGCSQKWNSKRVAEKKASVDFFNNRIERQL